jgi:hypothetical protein
VSVAVNDELTVGGVVWGDAWTTAPVKSQVTLNQPVYFVAW